MKKIIFLLLFLVGIITGFSDDKNYKQLKKELQNIWQEDQNIRSEYSKAWYKFGNDSKEVDVIRKKMRYEDSLHVIRVTQIIDENGWLGKDKVGQIGSNTLFLVIQHSDLKTQQKYLPLMQEAVKQGNSEASWLALLEDRVALAEGRKQIYGSQIHWDKKTDKTFVAPLEDPDNVDKRRKEMGLENLSDYLKEHNIIWNVEEYKKQLPEIELMEKNIKLLK